MSTNPNDGGPPREAVKQSDGSWIQQLEDGSTKKWTRRPDGSWRKPEHKRAGWVGELEREKYIPPQMVCHRLDDDEDEEAAEEANEEATEKAAEEANKEATEKAVEKAPEEAPAQAVEKAPEDAP